MDAIVKLYKNFIKDDTRKLAFFMPDIVERQLYEAFNIKGIILNQRYFVTNVGLATSNNHFIFHLADDVMQNLISAGIAQYLEKFYTDLDYPRYQEENGKEPVVLSIDDLNFGFVIWLVASGVSVMAFICEILHNCKVFLSNFLGLILFLKLLTHVMKFRNF